ncbi:MAG: lecithin--cholesterol acyltransferase [Cyanobacteria bacterium P01_F01_bin.143]
MAEKTILKDIVVILPGITGSVLKKGDKDLWGASARAIFDIVRSGGENLQQLKLEGKDSGGDEFGDGIVADRLVEDAQLIPGLIKILDGYSQTAKLITDNFEVTEGDIYKDPEDKAANFYRFPYDWRRDNRYSAKTLKRLLDIRLKAWRKSSGNSDAKVVLLAHSMGGLVSRYYLEVLGGWKDAKALFTFGTPYRGSLNAVNFIANGFKKASIDLTDVMRSLPSVYQLLPTLEVIKYKGKDYRVAEVPEPLPNFDQEMLKDAVEFHKEISEAVEKNKNQAGYSYITVPVVGIKQTTFQSAVFKNSEVTTFEDLPDVLKGRPDLKGGDGTVPEISAYPPEFTREQMFIARSISEKHGGLQAQEQILEDIGEILGRYQFDTSKLKGVRQSRGQKAIDLIPLEDIYFTDEVIEITAKSNIVANSTLIVEINSIYELEKPVSKSEEIKGQDNTWTLKIKDLPVGLYEITVSDKNGKATSVNDLFEVGNKSDYLA